MKQQILSSIHNPMQLEQLYRSDKTGFKRAFQSLYPELPDRQLADFWQARLQPAHEEITWGSRAELQFVLIAALLAGLIARMPLWMGLNEEFFYSRNTGFIVFPFLAAWFAWKQGLATIKTAIAACIMLASVIFINSLPDNPNSDTLSLSCIHMLLVLWSVLGFVFTGGLSRDAEPRLAFLKYNGDLVVMTTLIVLAGALLSGMTLGLFRIIGLDIAEFYFDNVIVFGLPAAPILATWLIRTNPQLVGRVSPVIARIFSPLVLAMLVIYLGAILYTGKDPYNDREFLLVFNILLIGVMAIIFFSVAASGNSGRAQATPWVLLLLSVVTLIVNGIALSAIIFRISEWGFTPNRTAVLGGNVLIFTNLLLVTVQLLRVVSGNASLKDAGISIVRFLPVYAFWAAVVTFVFPLLFGFR